MVGSSFFGVLVSRAIWPWLKWLQDCSNASTYCNNTPVNGGTHRFWFGRFLMGLVAILVVWKRTVLGQ